MGNISSSPYDGPLGQDSSPEIDFFLYRNAIASNRLKHAARILTQMRKKYQSYPDIIEFLASSQLRSASAEDLIHHKGGKYQMMYGV